METEKYSFSYTHNKSSKKLKKKSISLWVCNEHLEMVIIEMW